MVACNFLTVEEDHGDVVLVFLVVGEVVKNVADFEVELDAGADLFDHVEDVVTQGAFGFGVEGDKHEDASSAAAQSVSAGPRRLSNRAARRWRSGRPWGHANSLLRN